MIMLSSVPRSVVFRASRTEQRLNLRTFLSKLPFRTRKQHRLFSLSGPCLLLHKLLTPALTTYQWTANHASCWDQRRWYVVILLQPDVGLSGKRIYRSFKLLWVSLPSFHLFIKDTVRHPNGHGRSGAVPSRACKHTFADEYCPSLVIGFSTCLNRWPDKCLSTA